MLTTEPSLGRRNLISLARFFLPNLSCPLLEWARAISQACYRCVPTYPAFTDVLGSLNPDLHACVASTLSHDESSFCSCLKDFVLLLPEPGVKLCLCRAEIQ
uniref:Uncharacterized protein n=1 Tax=Mus musculus TaxID=10090 RepID=Q3UW49_MOUSE|nr:unnamed protein product [Mus musculus]